MKTIPKRWGVMAVVIGAMALFSTSAIYGQETTPEPTLPNITIDTQGLPYSWQAVLVPETPYDNSQPPGPVGLPEHVEILFGASSLEERQPNTPVMYIIPVEAYAQMWDEADNPAVSETIDRIFRMTVTLPQPPATSGYPVLPFEAAGAGYNDLATQVGRVTPDENSASRNGYRFVGRWQQDANPVTNQGLNYVYQGFTNDGKYLVSFWYPVSTPELPQTIADVPTADIDAFNADPSAYIAGQAEALNTLAPADWEPDLSTLDAVVASLQIEGMTASGLLDQTWRWIGLETDETLELLDDPSHIYEVTFTSDGQLVFTADCNQGTGTFTYSGGMIGSVRSMPGAMTLAACDDGGQGDQFVNSLAAAQDFRVLPGGTMLELPLPAGGPVMVLEVVDAS